MSHVMRIVPGGVGNSVASIPVPSPRPLQKDFESMALLRELSTFKLPCHCNRCLQHYRTEEQQDFIPLAYTGDLNEVKTFALARVHTEAIFSALNVLRQRIAVSGNAIQNKWRRKSPAQRRHTLLQARQIYIHTQIPCLPLPLLRYPGSRHWGRCITIAPRNSYHTSTSTACPVTQLDLSVFFIIARRLSLKTGSCLMTFKSNWLGTWASWRPNPPLAASQFLGRVMDCGSRSIMQRCSAVIQLGHRALLILEAQRTLMEFLRDVTAVIQQNSHMSLVDATSSLSIQSSSSCNKWMEFVQSSPGSSNHQSW